MAALVTVAANPTIDNTQKLGHVYCTLQISNSGYTPGGLTLDSVLLGVPGVTTNSGIKYAVIQSQSGSGYIYQRLSNGKLMILQVPPNGSLTTAAPLQEIPASLNMQGIANDVITCHFAFLRNA